MSYYLNKSKRCFFKKHSICKAAVVSNTLLSSHNYCAVWQAPGIWPLSLHINSFHIIIIILELPLTRADSKCKHTLKEECKMFCGGFFLIISMISFFFLLCKGRTLCEGQRCTGKSGFYWRGKNNKDLKTDATQNFGEHEKIIQFKLEGNFDKNNYLFKLEYDISPTLTYWTTIPLCNKTTLL